MKKVKVLWKDAWGINPSWESKEEALDHSYCMVETIGWLLKENEDSIWLVMSWDKSTNMVCGAKLIPKECVLEVEYLRRV
ncbi:MAG: hypothetical protein ACE5H1_00775 [Thermodesulfobacteriota bacterium]